MDLINCNIEIRPDQILINYPNGDKQRIKDYDLRYNTATGFFWAKTAAGLVYVSKSGCTVTDNSSSRINITIPDDDDLETTAEGMQEGVTSITPMNLKFP